MTAYLQWVSCFLKKSILVTEALTHQIISHETFKTCFCVWEQTLPYSFQDISNPLKPKLQEKHPEKWSDPSWAVSPAQWAQSAGCGPEQRPLQAEVKQAHGRHMEKLYFC